MKGPLPFEFFGGDPDHGGAHWPLPPRKTGPDGVELEYDLHHVKLVPPPSYLQVRLNLHLATKVRSTVVASWLLSRLGLKCDGLLHEGRDYRFDPSGLARLIDAWTADFPDGTPSDPPPDPPPRPPRDDDEGGLGVGARVRRRPPEIGGERFP